MNKALIIHHLRTGASDLVTEEVAAAGFSLDHRYPIEGEPLPANDEGYAIAVVHGSLADVTRHDAPGIAEEMRWIGNWWKSRKPYFGICHGLQLAAQHLGARVGPPSHGKAEFGYYPLISHAPDLVPDGQPMFQWHYYGADLPAGAERLACSELYPNQIVRFEPGRYGLQGHAELALAAQLYLHENDTGAQYRPGAQSIATQCALAERHAQGMHRWIRKFVRHWLAEAGHSRTPPETFRC
jgi:GMP synthase (glutamine-hydrolysing)